MIRSKISLLAVLVLFVSVLSAASSSSPALAEGNGAALTPQAGWSSWSFLRSKPTEANIKAQAQALHDTGLVGHGFTYANIDDYYYLDPATTVDPYGRWVVNTSRFPDGMANVAAYVHNLGEKFGMYLTPGIPVAAYNQNTPIQGTSFHARDIVSSTSSTESNYAFGSGRMYFIDYAKNPTAAQTFLNSWADLLASYGVDYLKFDGVHDSDRADVQHWSQALAQSGRTIHFELSNSLDVKNGAFWKQYANGWRTEGDIECYCSSTSYPLTKWSNVAKRFNDLPAWVQWDGPGGWGDPDSVELGNGSNDGLTTDERQTQLSLWAISNAPLVLGSDLTHMDAGDLALLSNDEVLGVDRSGAPGHPVNQGAQQQEWWSYTGNGNYTVALFNLASSTAVVTARWSDLAFNGSATVRDLWTHTDLGSFNGSYSASVPAHGSKLLHVVVASGATSIGSPLVSRLSGRCVDLPHQSSYSGVQLAVWDCNGGPDQRVTYSSSAKTLTVEGKCFDAYDNQTAARTKVELWDCNGGANQQWKLNSNGTITGVQSGICLDVTGSTNPNGSGLELWSCNGGDNQHWTLG